jgi:hypothetical protein
MVLLFNHLTVKYMVNNFFITRFDLTDILSAYL